MMGFNVQEFRSDEEFIGNILWIESSRQSMSEEDSLMMLWVEAEEYGDHISEAQKSEDFKIARDTFIYREISLEEFLLKTRLILSKFEKYQDKNIFGDSLSGVDYFNNNVFSDLNCGYKIYLLEENFSSYTAFILSANLCMLFSWEDVI